MSLDEDGVIEWEHRPDEQAGLTADEDSECAEVLHAEARVVEALRRRRISAMEQVHFETWGVARHEVPEEHRGKRVGITDVWHYPGGRANPYASPVSGLHFLVELNKMELLEVQDSFSVDRPGVQAAAQRLHSVDVRSHLTDVQRRAGDRTRPLDHAVP